MGSCKSLSLLKSNAVAQSPTSSKYPKRKISSVSTQELNFLQYLFKELCIRNNSRKLLEKSIFLHLIKLPVTPTQGFFGERMFNYLDTDNDGYIDEDQFLKVMEKYTKSENEAICEDIFCICDLNKDSFLDEEELLITVFII